MEFSLVSVHVGILFATVGVILFADKEAISWVLGKKEVLKENRIKTLHTLMWFGLLGMVTTGVFLFWPLKPYLLTQPVFFIKMFFVLVLVINGFFIGKLMGIATQRRYKDLGRKEKIPLFISGAISTVAWVGAIIGGLSLGV